MQIESDRLLLILLTYEQLILYLQGGQKLERSLNLEDSRRTTTAYHRILEKNNFIPFKGKGEMICWRLIKKNDAQPVYSIIPTPAGL